MSGEVLKEFLARLGFEVDEQGMKQFNTGLASATKRAMAMGAALQAMAIGIHAAVYRIASAQAQLLDLSDATGVAVADLEELGFVATITGSDAARLNSSIENLQKSMAETLLGKGGMEGFRRLGINIKDTNGQLRDTVDVLFEVGDKIKDMPTGKRAMFLSQLGIDRSLVRMLTEDISGLRDTYSQMYAVAGVDAQHAAEDSRAYVEEVKTLKEIMSMLAKSVAMTVINKMREDLLRFRKSIQENFGKISNVIQSVLKAFLRLAGAVGAILLRIGGWIGNLIEWFGRLEQGTQNLILVAGSLLAAWRLLNLGFLATPLGLILTGLLAIVAVVDDFMTWMEGGESLLDWGPWAGTIMEVVDALAPLMDALGQLWDMVKGPLFASFQWWGKYVATLIGDVARIIASFVLAIVRLFQGDFSGALQAVLDLLNNLLGLVGDALSLVGDLVEGAWTSLQGIFGSGDQAAPARPILGPTPAMAGATANTSINASTVISVDGARSPEATARAVGIEQRRVNADLVRNTKGAVR